jgi:hypothetical protein
VTAQLTIGAGLGFVLVPVMLLGIMLILSVSPLVGGAVLVIGFVALVVVSSALEQIFGAALYRYAVSGSVPPGMSAEDFDSVIKPRRGPFGRRAGDTKVGVPPAPPPQRPDVS